MCAGVCWKTKNNVHFLNHQVASEGNTSFFDATVPIVSWHWVDGGIPPGGFHD